MTYLSSVNTHPTKTLDLLFRRVHVYLHSPQESLPYFLLCFAAEIAEFDGKVYAALECRVKRLHSIGREEHDPLKVL